jgi:nucleoside-diphosphate-sugar epimerase
VIKHLNQPGAIPERTVVVGAGGFVGNAVTKRLQASGGNVLALTRRDVDLLAPDAVPRLAALFRPTDAVVAAAAIAPCKNIDMFVDNAVLMRGIVAALKQAPVAHVVNISSDAVYADGPLPLTEASPTAPTALHGAMHLAREIAFAAEVASPLVTLRPSLLYGAADPHGGYGPNRFRRLAAQGKPITLFGEGEERRDHVYIDDVAEIVFRVLCHRSVGVLNIATGEVHSFRDIAERVVRAAGRAVAIEPTPRSGPMPHNGYRPFDIAAIRSAFPDFSYTPLAEGIARAQAEAAGAA